jgi:hypothetical protein
MPYFGIPIRNGLPIGLGSVAGFGVQQFSPADLFSAGEQGAWYDPSDLTTLFTDSAGTVPVTGVEQFVGLMLDKSKGLVLGPELVTNGDFSSGTTGWTAEGTNTIAVVGGELEVTLNSALFTGAAGTAFTTVAGTTYRVTATCRRGTTGSNVIVRFGSTDITFTTTSNVTVTQYITATGASMTPRVLTVASSGSGTFYVDNISVKALPGNHATQTTSAKRPKLAARYNLLTYSEQFDNAAWTKQNVTVTQNAVIAPNGTLTADELINTAVTNNHFTEQLTITPVAGAAYRLTWRVKKNTVRYVVIGWNRTPTDNAGAGFDLDVSPPAVTGVGQIGSGYAASNAAATLLNDGWVELAVTLTGPALPQYATLVHRSTAYTSGAIYESYAGTTADKTYIWGADLRPASQATGLIGPTYQRVVDAATYDAAGFLPYLQFDGIDDVMSAGDVIDLGTSDLTGFVGVQQTGTIGTYYAKSLLGAATGRYSFLRDAGALTSLYDNGANRNATVSDSNAANRVLSQLLFRSAGTNTVQQNGVQVAAATPFTPESANWNTAYRFLIGAYNDATDTGETLYLNGRLYSSIVVLAQLSASQIGATESWVAGKTGVSL